MRGLGGYHAESKKEKTTSMLTMLRSALSWKNAWRIRIVALGFIVLVVGIGSQVLVNAFAADADTDAGLVAVKVSAYPISGRMADGNWTYSGACAVSTAQFPLGSIIALYNTDGTFNRQCTAEDTGIGYGHIDLAMPNDEAAALRWGVRDLLAQVVRYGWGPGGAPEAFSTSTVHAHIMQHFSKLHYRYFVLERIVRVRPPLLVS